MTLLDDQRWRALRDAHLLRLSLTDSRGRYGRYMAVIDELRQEASEADGRAWTARDVNVALYWLGG